MSIFAQGNLTVRRSKRHGVRICVMSSLLAFAFLYAVWQGSYWALAIPVALGVLTGLWLMFWIGYTISTVGTIPPQADQYDSKRARRIAQGICVGSGLLGVVFLVGIARQSYGPWPFRWQAAASPC